MTAQSVLHERMDGLWERVNREALEFKDSYLALDRLSDFSAGLAPEELERADEVLADWVRSGDEGRRFDAMALIRRFRVTAAVPVLRELAADVAGSDRPGAPFEREKAEQLARELAAG